MRTGKSFLLTILSLCATLIMGKVYADWKYFDAPADASHEVAAVINDWYYEENLPGGGENADEEFNEGISHAGIIRDILNDVKLYDKNDRNHDSDIIGAIEGAIEEESRNGNRFDHNGVGSSTKYNGVQLRDFAGSRGYENLGFFVYYGEGITDASEITRLEIYTYTLSDSSKSVGTMIEVYKTVATLKDGEWVLSGGYKGKAPIVQYGNSNTTGKYKNVIDATKWVRTD